VLTKYVKSLEIIGLHNDFSTSKFRRTFKYD
jgi:hypothetical protein